MSLRLPSRRALATAANGLRPATTTTTTTTIPTPTTAAAATTATTAAHGSVSRPPAARSLHTTPARAIEWGRLFGRRGGSKKAGSEPSAGMPQDLQRAKTREAFMNRMTNTGLDASPLLAEMGADEDGEAATKKPAPSPGGQQPPSRSSAHRTDLGVSLLRGDMARAVDPDPRSRVRWERKMVVRHVARLLAPAGRESPAETLARTERVLLHKSPPLPTSTKKLMHLARQIAGKTVDEALVQMRFSKKKMAQEVRWHLEEARDLAVVERGMGLGGRTARTDNDSENGTENGNDNDNDTADAPAPRTIQTKDGHWRTIADPTRMYVDQAYVGRGAWRAATFVRRARGRRTVEEKTRIRQHEERVTKEAKKAPWVHLPNRPVTAQRPYYSW
ncbi:mitochondrial large ribosomal subunit [Niveomyces insectorum RCEF 264]|uniref:Mitochondrial large ribosomal subunit n=1 Tax=Niveomyces insectorum RCEF 264 TaxID=1081102 RepID=A0A167UV54_9HYPO|nr:mitochondrial large ribosomal subunit [Niveomyces insectorum RCEF 264]